MRTNTQDIIGEVEDLLHKEEYQKAWQVIHENGKSIMMTNPKLCLMGIFALKAMSRHQEALAFIKKWLQKDPGNCEFLTIAGELSEKLSRYEEALRYFKRVDRLSPFDANRSQVMQDIRDKLKQSSQQSIIPSTSIEPAKKSAGRAYWRYIIWIVPVIVTAIFYAISSNMDSKYPFALSLLTSFLYFYAIYPLEIEKIRTLKIHYYNDEKIYFLTYLIILFEVIVIAIASLKFSCDCFANKNGLDFLWATNAINTGEVNNFWTYILFFINLSVIFLWFQTKGLKELTYGLRKFYFKTSLVVGLFYSAYAIHLANIDSLNIIKNVDQIIDNLKLFKDDMIPGGKGQFFKNLRDFSLNDLFHPSSWINKYHYDQANYYLDNLRANYPNLTEVWENVKNKNICELLDFYNKVVSSVVNKFFTAPLNYILLILVNLNIVVGFIFSIYIISIVNFFKGRLLR